MRSLFIRMRFIHWLGAIVLFMNATFFTDLIFSQIIQYIITIFLIIHDIDEKVWGVDSLKKVTEYMKHFERKNLQFHVPSIAYITVKWKKFLVLSIHLEKM